MRRYFRMVPANAVDLGFEQRDPLNQLGLRIRGEVLLREEAGRVTPAKAGKGAGTVVFVHDVESSRFHALAVNGPRR